MIKETKLDWLLAFISFHPGCTRKEILKGTKLSRSLLNMYLSSYYGYKEGSHRDGNFNHRTRTVDPTRKAYFATADYKPTKGRIIHTYYLNEEGESRVQTYLNKYVNDLIPQF